MNNTTERVLNDIEQLIKKRISVRAFEKNKPIPPELLTEIFTLATRAPSWKNAQSYKIVAVSGAKKDALCEEMVNAAKNEVEPNPVIEYETGHPSYIKKRMFTLGMALYDHLGIGRKDIEARNLQMARNFIGFDAPTMLFFYIPTKLREWSILDLGILLGHLCLVTESYDIGSCFQASLASYPGIIGKYTGMDSEKDKLVVGMSIGYVDKSDKSNSFYSDRAPVEDILTFVE